MQARDSSSDDSLESLQDGSLFMQDERMEEDAKHRIRADEEWQSSADEEQFPRSIEFLFYMISFLSSSNYCIMLVLGYLANGEITLSFLLQFSLFVLCESIGSAICSQLYERMHIKKIAILSAVSGMFASAVLTISSFSLLQMAQPSLVISARAVQVQFASHLFFFFAFQESLTDFGFERE